MFSLFGNFAPKVETLEYLVSFLSIRKANPKNTPLPRPPIPMFKNAFKLLTLLLPWPMRRAVLQRLFGFQIHPTARIGLAWVFPKRLTMAENTAIGHLTVAINLDAIEMKSHATIGRGNWITGFPTGTSSPHFKHQPDRKAQLTMGEHSAITNRHIIDCTNEVVIGKYSTLAGFRSQILTHSIDLEFSRQSSAPVTIGEYCFVGTDSVLLAGCNLPHCSVLGAKSLLTRHYDDERTLYTGSPARAIRRLPPEMRYFWRQTGFVE